MRTACSLLRLLQVFESLRSQADYEGLLRGLRAAGGSGSALPGLWVKGIAAQLRGRGQRVGRCDKESQQPAACMQADVQQQQQ
jgi:hypothetical protein